MTTGAVTAMWAWDNPVGVDVDPRGTGYAPAAAPALAAFAVDRGLRRVHLAAPWAADDGAIGAWYSAATAELAAAGVRVSALGGDPGWLDAPDLAVAWAAAALRAARGGADAVQLDVEPWTTPAWDADRAGVARRWLALLARVRAALPAGVALGVDAPWWLATTPGADRATSLLDEVIVRADRLSVVAFSDHAAGPDGIVALAAPAVRAATAAGLPCAVGVETDDPRVAGGPQFTFGDDGPAALAREAALAAAALARSAGAGFEGIAVEHHRAWRRLLGLDPR